MAMLNNQMVLKCGIGIYLLSSLGWSFGIPGFSIGTIHDQWVSPRGFPICTASGIHVGWFVP